MAADDEEKARRNAATLVAFVGLAAVAAAIFGLVLMVLGPAVSVLILALAAIIGIGALQYVTWGWKLDRDRVVDDDDPFRRR